MAASRVAPRGGIQRASVSKAEIERRLAEFEDEKHKTDAVYTVMRDEEDVIAASAVEEYGAAATAAVTRSSGTKGGAGSSSSSTASLSASQSSPKSTESSIRGVGDSAELQHAKFALHLARYHIDELLQEDASEIDIHKAKKAFIAAATDLRRMREGDRDISPRSFRSSGKGRSSPTPPPCIGDKQADTSRTNSFKKTGGEGPIRRMSQKMSEALSPMRRLSFAGGTPQRRTQKNAALDLEQKLSQMDELRMSKTNTTPRRKSSLSLLLTGRRKSVSIKAPQLASGDAIAPSYTPTESFSSPESASP